MCGCPSPAAPALQIGLFLLAYAVYTVARFFTIGDLADATANAHWIVDLQNAVGVGVESSVQNALDGSWVMWVLNRLYLVAQLGVIPAVLIFLYNRSWAIYATLRNTILATWLISVPIYGLFPVAPPRLAGIGIKDTITSQTGVSMTSNFSTSFFNELAAVPSLHVGFAVAVGFALFAALKNPRAEVGGAAVGPDRRPGRGRHRQPLRLRRDRRPRRRRAGLRPGAMAARIRIKRPTPRQLRAGVRRGLSRAQDQRERGADHGQHRARADEERGQLLRRHVLAGHRAEQAARIAAPAPTLAGENGTSRPLHCANVTSRTAANVAGRWNAARKQPSAASRSTRAEQLPRQHVPRVGASGHFSAEQPVFTRVKKRRAFAWRRPSRTAPVSVSSVGERRSSPVWASGETSGPTPMRQRQREQAEAQQGLPRRLGDERAGQQRAGAAAGHPAGEQEHAHRVSPARGHHTARSGAGHPRHEGVAPARRRLTRRADDGEPAQPTGHLVRQVKQPRPAPAIPATDH